MFTHTCVDITKLNATYNKHKRKKQHSKVGVLNNYMEMQVIIYWWVWPVPNFLQEPAGYDCLTTDNGGWDPNDDVNKKILNSESLLHITTSSYCRLLAMSQTNEKCLTTSPDTKLVWLCPV